MNELDAMSRYRQLLRQDVPVPPLDVVAQVVASLDLSAEQIGKDIATVKNHAAAQCVHAGLADLEHERGLARRVYRDLDRQLAARVLLHQSKGATSVDRELEGQVSRAANRTAELSRKVDVAQAAKATMDGIEQEFGELFQTQ